MHTRQWNTARGGDHRHGGLGGADVGHADEHGVDALPSRWITALLWPMPTECHEAEARAALDRPGPIPPGAASASSVEQARTGLDALGQRAIQNVPCSDGRRTMFLMANSTGSIFS
jgi:hypothetical protein